MNEQADKLELEIQLIGPDLTPDEVAGVLVKVNAYMEAARAMEKACRAALVQYITDTGRPIVIGPVRYYVGDKRETKCKDQAECHRELVEQFGPDEVGKLFLGSGALKHGAIRKEAPDTYDRWFEVVVKPVLKEDGTPEKQLQTFDERFVR